MFLCRTELEKERIDILSVPVTTITQKCIFQRAEVKNM